MALNEHSLERQVQLANAADMNAICNTSGGSAESGLSTLPPEIILQVFNDMENMYDLEPLT